MTARPRAVWRARPRLPRSGRWRRGRARWNRSWSARWRGRSLDCSGCGQHAAALFDFLDAAADVVTQLPLVGFLFDCLELVRPEVEEPLALRVAFRRQGIGQRRPAIVQPAIGPVLRGDAVRDDNRGADQTLADRAAIAMLWGGQKRERNEPLESVALAATIVVQGHQTRSWK